MALASVKNYEARQHCGIDLDQIEYFHYWEGTRRTWPWWRAEPAAKLVLAFHNGTEYTEEGEIATELFLTIKDKNHEHFESAREVRIQRLTADSTPVRVTGGDTPESRPTHGPHRGPIDVGRGCRPTDQRGLDPVEHG